MSNNEKLCPFCNGEYLYDDTELGCTECQSCGAKGPTFKMTNRNAIDSWNQRPREAELEERIEELKHELEEERNSCER